MSARAEAAALDHRSLALPDWRDALKRRVKRPRKRDKVRLLIAVGQVVAGVGLIAYGAAACGVLSLVMGVIAALEAFGLLGARSRYWGRVSNGLLVIYLILFFVGTNP